MSIRVTQAATFDSAKRGIDRTLARLFASQQAVSTGRRVNTPSDDPDLIARLLALKRRSKEIGQFSQNAAEGRAFVASGASNLQEISGLLTSVRERALLGLNGTQGPIEREIIAQEIDGALDDIIALANGHIGGRFLFSGTASSTQPFASQTDAGGQQTVAYRGNDGAGRAEIGPGVSAALNVPGSRIFLNDGLADVRIQGVTGARPGTGASGGHGVDRLTVAHGTTSYSGGGLAASASSAGADTVIGSHSIRLIVDPTGGSGTIALNGGVAQSFTNPQTDFSVRGPNGEVVHVDLTGVTAGFDGTVSLDATGTISLDGGTTVTPITFATDQQVVDSGTGDVLSVDTSAITRTGTDAVHYAGTLDIFSTLIALRDGLRTAGSNGDLQGDIERVRSFLSEIDAAHDRVLRYAGELGSTDARLQAADSRLQDLDVRIRELVSKSEEVDLSEAVVNLRADETAYQSALLITSRVNQLSLLNFI